VLLINAKIKGDSIPEEHYNWLDFILNKDCDFGVAEIDFM
jgi:hypothetical protein